MCEGPKLMDCLDRQAEADCYRSSAYWPTAVMEHLFGLVVYEVSDRFGC